MSADTDSLKPVSLTESSEETRKSAVPNYRLEFGHVDALQQNFPSVYWPTLREIFQEFDYWGVEQYWFHFEPHVELTWIDENEDRAHRMMDSLALIIARHGWKIINQANPGTGTFADWYYTSPNELLFGIASLSASCQLARTFYEHNYALLEGKGLERMYQRRCHILANQLGIGYKKEFMYLLRRAILAFLFWVTRSQKKAVWIARHIFRIRY